jgi:ABC-type Fe3+-siderophore transport system permease subunit
MPETTYVRSQILPPVSKSLSTSSRSNEDLNYVATLLDDKFSIPGTGIRFGLDALIGWIPGIGDALAALASLFIVFAAWQRGAAQITLIRMLLNLTIEATIGAIPIVGDAAHVAWKANRRNYNLLVRDQQSLQRRTWRDWMFVIAALLVMAVLFVAPWVLLIYEFRSHHLF